MRPLRAAALPRAARRGMASMALKTGIVGMPNVGKSTLFNALMQESQAQAANFPFCTIEPNVGVIAVPDPRLQVRLMARVVAASIGRGPRRHGLGLAVVRARGRAWAGVGR